MLEISNGSVSFTASPEDFAEILRQAGCKVSASDLDAKYVKALAAGIEAFARDPFIEGAGGGVQALAGGVHFNLPKTGFATLVAALSIASAIASGGTLPILAASAAALYALHDKFSPLKNEEKAIYMAVQGVSQERKAAGKTPPGATEVEAAKWLDEKAMGEVEKFNEFAEDLVQRKILKAEIGGGARRYTVT
jgi:hypothetical protein